MKNMIVLLLLSLTTCSHLQSQDKYISPNKYNIQKALDIVVDEFNKKEIFNKEQMLSVLQKNFITKHKKCESENHNLNVVFIKGKWSEKKKRFCIFSKEKYFKEKCLKGLFDGNHTITMINSENNKIYNTSFAHEMLHYFQKYISGISPKKHLPIKLWENLVGYKTNKIGSVNIILKKADL